MTEEDSDKSRDELEEKVRDLEYRIAKLEVQVNGEVSSSDSYESSKEKSTGDSKSSTNEDRGRFSNWDIESKASKGFVILGGLLLIFGTIFFIQLAISEGIIGPLGQLIIASVAGLIIAYTGRFVDINKRYYPWGKTVTGTGIIISYIAIYASYASTSYRDAISTPKVATFAILCVFLAVFMYDMFKREEYGLTALLTVLVWSNLLFASLYMSNLVLAISLVASVVFILLTTYLRYWSLPVVISIVPLYGFSLNIINTFSVESTVIQSIIYLTVFIVILLATEIRKSDGVDISDSKTPNSIYIPILSIPVSILFMSFPYTEVGTEYGIVLMLATFALLVTYIFSTEQRNRKSVIEPFMVYLLIAVSLTALADDFVRIVGLSIAIIIGFLSTYQLEDKWMQKASITASVLLFIDAMRTIYLFENFNYIPLQIEVASASILVCLTLLYYSKSLLTIKSKALQNEYLGFNSESIGKAYAWAGTVTLVLFFEVVLTGVTLSIAWASTGLLLILLGSYYDIRRIRIQGSTLLAITTGKVLLIDTAELELLPRVVSFIIVGLILLATSYIYAKKTNDFKVTDYLNDEE